MSPAKGAGTSGSSRRKKSSAATAAATGGLSFSTVDATPSASGDGGGGSVGGDGGPSADSLLTSLPMSLAMPLASVPMPVPLPVSVSLPLPASASSSSDTATAAASSALALVSPFALPPLAIGAAMTSSVAPVSQSQPASATRKNQITSSAAKNVPAFLNKLYNMVSDPASSDLIHWSDDGQAFIVERHEEFAQTLLPRFFKHNQFSSFVRQLNMYGFRKVPHLQAGALIQQHQDGTDAGGSESWEFANPHFQRNHPDLLCLVTRKKAGQSTVLRASVVSDGRRSGANDSENDNSDSYVSNGISSIRTSGDPKSLSSAPSSSMVEKTVDVNALLTEISAIKRHQITISTDLKTIQREHQALWDERIVMRENFRRQQETIDKIVRFLATVFESRNRHGAVTAAPHNSNSGSVSGNNLSTGIGIGLDGTSAVASGTPLTNGNVGGLSGDDMLDVGIDGVIGGFTGNTGGGSFSNASPLNYSFEGGAAVNGLLGDVSANPKKRKLLLGDSDTVDVISAGPAGMGPPAFVAQKRMPSIPSATAENILELLDDKIFELIQSPPFSDTIPIDEPLTQPAPVVSTPQDAMVGEPNFVVPRVGIAATQQRIHNAQEKANRIQEDIDKLDSHLVNTSSLLGIQDLDMDDFFGLNGAGIDENETDAGVSAVPDGVSAGTVLQLDGDRNDSLFGL